MKLIDLHCDTLLLCCQNRWPLARNAGHIDVEKLRAGGAMAQMFAVYIPTGEDAEDEGMPADPYETFCRIYDTYKKELALNGESLAPVLCFADLEKNRRAGKISSVLTVEEGALLDNRLDRVDELFAKGVRMITLTWNYENCIGYPNSKNSVEMARGLKPFGFDVIRRMNKLGMIIDVSHLSDGGFADVARCSTKPFVASHSCARALCDNPRNLTDAQLRLLADCGGVVGVNFKADFLKPGSRYTEIESILMHMKHIKKVAGIDVLAIGTDFDGIDCAVEIGNYAGMPKLIEAMELEFTSNEIEKICRNNVLRVVRDTMG